MNPTWRRELPLLVILALMAIIAAWSMDTLPERVPVHWNALGDADAFGSRTLGAWFAPVLAAGLYLLTLVVPRLDRSRTLTPGFSGAYHTLRVSLIVFMLFAYVVTQAAMHGISFSMTRAVVPLLGALFIVMGWTLGKLPPGIGATTAAAGVTRAAAGESTAGTGEPGAARASTAARVRRMSRDVFVMDGLLFIAAGIVAREWALWAALAGVLVGAIRLVVFAR